VNPGDQSLPSVNGRCTVTEKASVALDSGGSILGPISYRWTQSSGTGAGVTFSQLSGAETTIRMAAGTYATIQVEARYRAADSNGNPQTFDDTTPISLNCAPKNA
jgi:hypothetical protein